MNWEKLLSPQRIRKSKPTDIRNAFESDFGRIIYSPALRRMHDKTQVFPLTTDDNIHSRLTHSNEVMSLGYTFGIKLSQSKKFQERTRKSEVELLRIIPILLQNVCLIHDIGNSPFGHFGEDIISNYFSKLEKEKKEPFHSLNAHQKKDFLLYDGNAQGLRVLTKLQILNDPFGLNLTYATLASSLKYPNFEITNKEREKDLIEKGEILDVELIENKKHGIFFSERKYFELIVENVGLKINDRVIRHPLAYLMEAADSIAYLCMDMEDGFNKGIYSLRDIQEKFKSKNDKNSTTIEICEKVLNTIDNNFTDDISYKIVKIRIDLIQYLVTLAFKNFEDNLEKIENGEYNCELIEDDKNEIFEILKDFSYKIFKTREINNLESTGYSVMVGLLDFYIDFVFNKKDDKFLNKAKALISNSIIDAAIEETLIKTCSNKVEGDLEKLNIQKENFKDKTHKKLEEKIQKAEDKKKKFDEIKEKYEELLKLQVESVLEANSDDYKELTRLRRELYNLVEPQLNDLDDYYKFRVIVDFISGMTDQYALKHYQKISGQRIN